VLLTPAGERVIRELVIYHRTELTSLGPALLEALQRVLHNGGRNSSKGRKNKK